MYSLPGTQLMLSAIFHLIEASNYRTTALISHASKVMLKILQARLQQHVNHELPDVQARFIKGRGTRDLIVPIISMPLISKQQRNLVTFTNCINFFLLHGHPQQFKDRILWNERNNEKLKYMNRELVNFRHLHIERFCFICVLVQDTQPHKAQISILVKYHWRCLLHSRRNSVRQCG